MTDSTIHKRLIDYKEIAHTVRLINDRINGCGFSFKEDSDGETRSVALSHVNDNDKAIIILASFDFSYYHDLEMIFYDVSYSTGWPGYCWWDHWTKDQIELAAHDPLVGEFEFRFNRGTEKDEHYVIRTRSFSYYLGHVSYHHS